VEMTVAWRRDSRSAALAAFIRTATSRSVTSSGAAAGRAVLPPARTCCFQRCALLAFACTDLGTLRPSRAPLGAGDVDSPLMALDEIILIMETADALLAQARGNA
jgi:hypothetical protein